MTFDNIIQERLHGFAKQLLDTLESAGTIPHSTTVGDIREAAIFDSIRRFLPPGLDACSGFVTDTQGTITPQLDIILFRREALAPFLLEGRSALVPFETFGLAIEQEYPTDRAHPASQRGQCHGQCPGRFGGLHPSTSQTLAEFVSK
jgi:hypothetical protein